MKLTNVNVRMRDMCAAAAEQGMALDFAWCDEVRGRNEGCVIPPAYPRTRTNWRRTMFASDDVPASPSPWKDTTMATADPSKLLAFLSDKLSDGDLASVQSLLSDMGVIDAPMASDAARRVLQANRRNAQAAHNARLTERFPNAARLR